MIQTHAWPPLSTQAQPHVLRVKPSNISTPDKVWTAAFAEDLIADLYAKHQWQILQKRFRMRGSEIDLAVMQPTTKSARIIEVKLRKNQTKIDFEFVSNLLPTKKIEAIRRGARALADRYTKEGLCLDWSFDFVLVTPDPHGKSCVVFTWANAVEFG